MVAMSNNNQDWYEDDDLDFEDFSNEPQRGSSDDVLKKVRRAERSKDKQLKEALAELESLRKFQRESTISQVLNEKGVNPKVAKFIPSDIELSNDSISAWLSDNGDLFGFATSAQESPVSLEDLGALRQMDMVASGALTPDDVNDAFSMVNNAQSAEELLNYLYSQGAD
jgi:superfamily I DNA/RNA helicase